MKIIQIMPEFGLAGAETMCENLTYELIKAGHIVLVISMYEYHTPITDRLERSNIRVIYLNKKPGLDVSMIFKMWKIFCEEKPDVIHTHLYVMEYAIPAAVIAHIKGRVHTVHNVAQKENGRIARKLNKIFYKYAHVVPVALSEIVKETITEEYHIAARKIPVIYNGIDLTRCQPKTDYSAAGKFSILHIGRFTEQKNHIGLLKAFGLFHAQYPNSVLKLIGNGETRANAENYVKEHDLSNSIEFLGVQSNVYGFLHNADIFTLPSLYEGIPMTLIEASGTGLPIVATAVGGVPDMLKDGESALLTDVDEKAIARAFEMLAQNKKLREQLGQKALDATNKFSSREMAQKYIAIYSKLNCMI